MGPPHRAGAERPLRPGGLLARAGRVYWACCPLRRGLVSADRSTDRLLNPKLKGGPTPKASQAALQPRASARRCTSAKQERPRCSLRSMPCLVSPTPAPSCSWLNCRVSRAQRRRSVNTAGPRAVGRRPASGRMLEPTGTSPELARQLRAVPCGQTEGKHGYLRRQVRGALSTNKDPRALQKPSSTSPADAWHQHIPANHAAPTAPIRAFHAMLAALPHAHPAGAGAGPRFDLTRHQDPPSASRWR